MLPEAFSTLSLEFRLSKLPFCRAVLLAVGLASVSGCSDRADVLEPRVALRTQNLEDSTTTLHGLDLVFDSVARLEPAFAGAFFDGKTVVVALARDEASDLALREMKRILRARLHCQVSEACDKLVPTEFRFASVRNSWQDLVAARSAVLSGAEFHSVHSIDMNEQANALNLSVRTSEDSASVAKSLAVRRMADDLVRVKVEPLPQPTQASATLLDRLRPILGGLQIGPSGCTMAIVGVVSGSVRLITNAHCTGVRFQLDYQQISQPFGFSLWGYEIFDPAPYRCGPWYARKNCRRADQAHFMTTSIDLMPEETTPFLLGAIALPVERLYGPAQTYGSLSIGSSGQVIATQDFVLQGENLERVGVATGWQYGLVSNTCVDATYSSFGITIVCNDHSSTYSQTGDSGGPVFRMANWDPSTLIFVGINHGRNGSSTSISSNFRQMKQEVPSICFWYGC